MSEISILVKIDENLDFSQNFRKISILVNIYVNLDLGQNWWKSRFRSKMSKNFDLVNIYGNLDFGQNSKMSILVVTEENIDFSRNLQKDWFW